MKIEKVLKELGIEKINSGVSTGTKWQKANGAIISSYSPVDGKLIAKVTCASPLDYKKTVEKSNEAFKTWRQMPAPKRGEIVRQMGKAFRKYKEYYHFLYIHKMNID
jgi:aldehyde dehydrogenase (NAD+)